MATPRITRFGLLAEEEMLRNVRKMEKRRVLKLRRVAASETVRVARVVLAVQQGERVLVGRALLERLVELCES